VVDSLSHFLFFFFHIFPGETQEYRCARKENSEMVDPLDKNLFYFRRFVLITLCSLLVLDLDSGISLLFRIMQVWKN